jgi:hypothetical protein
VIQVLYVSSILVRLLAVTKPGDVKALLCVAQAQGNVAFLLL